MICSKLQKGIAVLVALSMLLSNSAFAQTEISVKPNATRQAVPENLVDKAVVPGFKDIRTFADEPSPVFKADLIQSMKDETKGAFPVGRGGKKDYAILTISGGGADGAYGAGILSGWTKSGTRPNFKIITGISTGALISPFIFLGPDYDGQMKEMYTTIKTDDIMTRKAGINIKGMNSFAHNRGLKDLIDRNVTEEIIAAIAEEHKKGKRLYVATANLDTQRLVIWDMGKIAQAGDEKAIELFREILLAATGIPILFPPTYIDVVVGEKEYKEIHVDGNTITSVIAMVNVFDGFKEAAAKEGLDRNKMNVSFYIIRNGSVDPRWNRVRNNIPSIAEATLGTMFKYQGINDLIRIYTLSQAKDIDFNLAYIPDSYVPKSEEMFDPEDMNRLFDIGFKEASKGYSWKKKPPFMEDLLD